MTGSETATTVALRARGLSRVALAVAGLVVVSTLVRFAVAQAFTVPWIAPDEMVYGMVGEALWSDGTLSLRGLPAPYYSLLTPALVGAPLALFSDLADGIRWAQLLQALAMSLVAVPVYVWARRLGPARWALAAAAIVLAAPLLHYSGFLMTEPLTLVMVTVALLMLARALEEPSYWRYGVFVAWTTGAAAVRLQALVLLPAFVLAAALDATAARDRTRLRPLIGLGAVAVVAVAIVVGIVAATGGLSLRGILGAYTPVGESPPASAGAVSEIAWHAFDVALIGLGVPVLAIAALTARAFSRRDADPRLRAFVCTALGYTALLVVQVGLFSAAFVGHVAERYLVTVLPLLAIGLSAWIARGAPREPVTVLPALGVLLVLAATVPIAELVAPGTLVNTLTPAPLAALGSGAAPRLALVGTMLAAGALVLLLPRGQVWIAAAAVGVGLTLISVDTARRIDDASAHEERATIGSDPPAWLDEAGLDGATMLVTGDRTWTAAARTLFWNRAVDAVVRVSPAALPFPPDTPAVTLAGDGTLTTADGSQLSLPLVVAPETFVVAGDKVAERPAGDSETPGLVAWRPREPVRAELWKQGFLPNGDFTGTAQVTVFACRPGTLDVTILGKTGDPVRALVDGIGVATLETPAGESAIHRIPAPPYANGTRPCVFTLETEGYAGSTAIVFAPA